MSPWYCLNEGNEVSECDNSYEEGSMLSKYNLKTTVKKRIQKHAQQAKDGSWCVTFIASRQWVWYTLTMSRYFHRCVSFTKHSTLLNTYPPTCHLSCLDGSTFTQISQKRSHTFVHSILHSICWGIKEVTFILGCYLVWIFLPVWLSFANFIFHILSYMLVHRFKISYKCLVEIVASNFLTQSS